ncbi:hypothetical protein F5X96DRAFT_333882 [Biscogniauxia mediterranea]|nr:hypothetical protein F5X96DRAFT_333882 [Biscogniauxia mediterranea]
MKLPIPFILLSFLLPRSTASLPPGVHGPRWPSFLEAPSFHLETAAKDVLAPAAAAAGAWLEQAGKDVGRELGKASEAYRDADNNNNQWRGLLEDPGLHLSIALGDAGRGLEALLGGAAAWARDTDANLRADPAQTLLGAGLDAAKVALMFVPGLLWRPVVGVFGFGAAGVGSGTVAAAAQSHIGGTVAKGSSFAVLQSAGARGYGAAALDMVVRGAVVAWSGVEALVKKVGQDGRPDDK